MILYFHTGLTTEEFNVQGRERMQIGKQQKVDTKYESIIQCLLHKVELNLTPKLDRTCMSDQHKQRHQSFISA
jgi:hypothetical protein